MTEAVNERPVDLEQGPISEVRFGRSRFLRTLGTALFGFAAAMVASPEEAEAAHGSPPPGCGGGEPATAAVDRVVASPAVVLPTLVAVANAGRLRPLPAAAATTYISAATGTTGTAGSASARDMWERYAESTRTVVALVSLMGLGAAGGSVLAEATGLQAILILLVCSAVLVAVLQQTLP